MENFTRKDESPTIEEFIQKLNSIYGEFWKSIVRLGLKEEATIWWSSLGIKNLSKFSNEELEKLLMDKWSQARKKYKGKHVGLFCTSISLLQVHGLIKKEKIIVSINPSCKNNVINVNLAKNLQVLAKPIENIQVNDEDVQVYKYFKISMDKYVFQGDFYTSEMDNMDVVLGYPWMESVGTINTNLKKKFLKL